MPWIQQLRSFNWVEIGSIVLGAYLLGCFTTGYYLIRRRTGQDVRNLGSGNVGARNIGRLFGWKGFALTLAGDFAKGACAVWVAGYFTPGAPWLALPMLAVVVGHIWPVQLRFRGGKGIATSLGALVAYDVHLAFAFLALFVCLLALMRRTVLPCLLAFAFLPWISFYLDRDGTNLSSSSLKVVSLLVLAAVIWIAHRKNLAREISGLMERYLPPKPKPHDL
ncbi:MAG TPA: glycerol-3-phosphate acyltransferase [Clostridia bacterium]|nr:glycerol-3-phosphate acyltransferase [Clostridia bacterium]